MSSTLGTPLPRQPYGRLYFYVAGGAALLTSIYGWGLTQFFAALALLLYVWPYLLPRQKETVQVDDDGVIVQTAKGLESLHWPELRRIRIVTTASGPWSEDVFFVLEASNGKGCVVPHDAAVRTKLLEEIQARLTGLDDTKVIEAMGSTSDATFTVWEKRDGAV
jgi:hypothetical protein